jgi:hypothetical protein
MSHPTTHAPGTNGVPSPELPPVELAEDGLPPFSEESLARFRELDWLDQQYNLGTLRPYIGEYVVSANHTILSHHRRMDHAIQAAELKANELGIPLEVLTVYNVPSVDDFVE